MELASLRSCCFVPYPLAAENHQEKNAWVEKQHL
jgi:UDP-N-acetylglucosamine:LPS N-acetylglucosamine transferase